MNFPFIKFVFFVDNYRYYFLGQVISLIGTWMASTATNWLVWRLSGSASILGLSGFLNTIPPLILSYPAGVIADRINIKKGLYITQLTACFFAFLLSFLTLFGFVKIWHVILIGFLLGISGAFDMPFRQSFVARIVPKNILHSVVAMNSVMFNLSRILGPTIAGLIIGYAGEGLCFLLNAFSYFAIIFALAKIKPYDYVKDTSANFSKSFINGLKYVWNTAYIKYPIIHMLCLSFVITPIITMMPVYVSNLKGGPKLLGFLISFVGLGAIFGGFSLAVKRKAKNYVRMINIFSTLYGISLFLLSLSKSIYLSLFFLFIAGIGTSRQAVGINTIIQSLVAENFRGRVISIYSMSFMGLAPLGNLTFGYITNRYGIGTTLLLASIWVIASNIFFYFNMSKVKRRLRISEERFEYEVL